MGKYYTCDVAFIFKLNENLCNHCMLCVNECQYGALHYEDGKFSIDGEKCSRCETCAGVCSREAIKVNFEMGELKDAGERVDQEIFIADITESTADLS